MTINTNYNTFNFSLWNYLPRDIQHNILSFLPFKELQRDSRVCKQWYANRAILQVGAINRQRLALEDCIRKGINILFDERWEKDRIPHHPTPGETIHWIQTNSIAARQLTYFVGTYSFTEQHIQSLAMLCPNITRVDHPGIVSIEAFHSLTQLKHLNLIRTKLLSKNLEGLVHLNLLENLLFDRPESLVNSSLNSLVHVPNLRRLRLSYAKLHGEALLNLRFVTQLTDLDLDAWDDLYSQAVFEPLKHLPHLKRLSLKWSKFPSEALCSLRYVSLLESLELRTNSEVTSLDFLRWLPRLKKLDIGFFNQLQKDALESLSHVPGLTSLKIRKCPISPNATEHLRHVTHLRVLKIHEMGLSPDFLNNLHFVSQLSKLSICLCSLNADAFKNLKFVTNLRSLTVSSIRVDPYFLSNLRHVKYLKKLDVGLSNCATLQPLKFVTQLTEVNLYSCESLLSGELRYLFYTPQLSRLNLSGCNQFIKPLLPLQWTKRLKILDISNLNRLDKTDLQEMIEYLPDLQQIIMYRVNCLNLNFSKSK